MFVDERTRYFLFQLRYILVSLFYGFFLFNYITSQFTNLVLLLAVFLGAQNSHCFYVGTMLSHYLTFLMTTNIKLFLKMETVVIFKVLNFRRVSLDSITRSVHCITKN